MKSIDNSKKAMIILVTYVSLLFGINIGGRKNKVVFNDNYVNPFLPYAYYGDSSIYIGDKDEIDLIKDADDNNIYIIDDRNNDNPNMCICDSYKIKDIRKIREILKILIKYEQDYDTSWDRSLTSMEREWIIHNICCYLNYEQFRSSNVDLDNNDENNYDTLIHLLNKLKEIYSLEIEREKARSLSKF